MEERNKLILDNLNLIHLIMNKMYINKQIREYVYDYALDGLIRGADTFDRTRGFAPSTYLARCIRTSINKYFYLSGMKKRKANTISLDQNINDYSDITYSDVIPDDNTDILKGIIEKENITEFKEAIRMLDDKSQVLLDMYFGIYTKKTMTKEEIGKMYGVSRQAIDGRLKRIIIKIKEIISEGKENDGGRIKQIHRRT